MLKKILQRLTSEARDVLEESVNLAISYSHNEVCILHILHSLISSDSLQHTITGNLTQEKRNYILSHVEQELFNKRKACNTSPVFSDSLITLFENIWFSINETDTSLSIDIPVIVSAMFNHHELLPDSVCAAFCNIGVIPSNGCSPSVQDVVPDIKCILDKYTTNFSWLAREGKLDPVTGREKEIRQIVDILLRRRQNNPLLTGAPGVGKTAIVEGLALRIASNDVPEILQQTEIFSLDMGALLAGAGARGEFESRLKQLLNALSRSERPVILFIDEAHSLTGAGGISGQTDAANLLKPVLARGQIRIIAATTWKEYKKFFEKDGALARRFQLIQVCEPEDEMAEAMLRSLLPTLEKHHRVRIREEAVKASVYLSNRYIYGRQQPDKAVSVLDTACSHVTVSQNTVPGIVQDIRVYLEMAKSELNALNRDNIKSSRKDFLEENINKLQKELSDIESVWMYQRKIVERINKTDDPEIQESLRKDLYNSHYKDKPLVFDCVNKICIADVISDWSGVPLGTCLEGEQQKSHNLLLQMQKHIFGQDHVLAALTSQIIVSRANLKDSTKPDGIFFFAGPSGTGKTETARTLAELVYGNNNFITINMSEFQESHTVSTLKGAPPGYVGYGQGGVLTEKVSHNPYSVILLDEIEKAHQDVIEFFYQIFDYGIAEDSEGKVVSFRDTIIIMTSNFACSELLELWERGERNHKKIKESLFPCFERKFTPAFMGRVNFVPFLPLTDAATKKIINAKLDKVSSRVSKISGGNVEINFSDSLLKWLKKKFTFGNTGAREIDTFINFDILPILSEYIISIDRDIPCLIVVSIRNNAVNLSKHDTSKS